MTVLVVVATVGSALLAWLIAAARSNRKLPRHPGGWGGAWAEIQEARTYPPRRDHMADAIDTEEAA